MLVIEVLLCLVFSVVLGWWMSKQALRPVRAFNFYRAECVRPDASGNSGLGLSIARSLLRACGGWIDARSEEGKYTRMEFFMPSGNENTEKQGEKTRNTKK